MVRHYFLRHLALTFQIRFISFHGNLLHPQPILIPLRLIITSLVVYYLSKLLFSGFLQSKGTFVHGKNTVSTETVHAPSAANQIHHIHRFDADSHFRKRC